MSGRQTRFPPAGALLRVLAVATIVLTGCGSSATPAGRTGSGHAPSHAGRSGARSTAPTTPIPERSGGSAPVGSASASRPQRRVASSKSTIKDFAYKVAGAARPGGRVSVTNDDGTTHTVTADSGNAFNVTVEPGRTVTFTAPDRPGTYGFHCEFHATMHGTLRVR